MADLRLLIVNDGKTPEVMAIGGGPVERWVILLPGCRLTIPFTTEQSRITIMHNIAEIKGDPNG